MNGVMSKYVRHVSLFWFMLVVRISCYEFSIKLSFFSRFHRNSIRQLQLSNLKVASAKTSISPVDFHPRLAVSKWIVPRSFLMGGVLGYYNQYNTQIGITNRLSVHYTYLQRIMNFNKKKVMSHECHKG
jgi:hypothetical protein